MSTFEGVENDLSNILKQNGLKNTSNRQTILKLFTDVNFALSYQDIETIVKGGLDKVTIYRTLKSFQEKGMIHEVYDNGTAVKYALCNHGSCSASHHHDAHAHFKCVTCDHTFCLDDVTIPTLNLPEGYQPDTVKLLVEGICVSCKD